MAHKKSSARKTSKVEVTKDGKHKDSQTGEDNTGTRTAVQQSKATTTVEKTTGEVHEGVSFQEPPEEGNVTERIVAPKEHKPAAYTMPHPETGEPWDGNYVYPKEEVVFTADKILDPEVTGDSMDEGGKNTPLREEIGEPDGLQEKEEKVMLPRCPICDSTYQMIGQRGKTVTCKNCSNKVKVI